MFFLFFGCFIVFNKNNKNNKQKNVVVGHSVTIQFMTADSIENGSSTQKIKKNFQFLFLVVA